MFEIKVDENDEMYCDGSIDLDFLGVYNSDMIRVEGEYIPLQPKKTAGELREEAKVLTEKYNLFVSDIKENISKIKNQFMLWLFEDLIDCDFEFWQCEGTEFPSFIIKDKMPSVINEETIYSKASGENYDIICEEVFNKPADDVSGIDVFKKYLPMIDIEKLLSTIIPSSIGLSEHGLEFEINSDECDGFLLLATVGSIDNELNLEIWDNRG